MREILVDYGQSTASVMQQHSDGVTEKREREGKKEGKKNNI